MLSELIQVCVLFFIFLQKAGNSVDITNRMETYHSSVVSWSHGLLPMRLSHEEPPAPKPLLNYWSKYIKFIGLLDRHEWSLFPHFSVVHGNFSRFCSLCGQTTRKFRGGGLARKQNSTTWKKKRCSSVRPGG